MKRILVLTDLSDNAAHVATNAMKLATQLHAGLILYHTMLSIPVVPTYAGGAFVTETVNLFAEDSHEKLITLAAELQKASKANVPVEIKNGEGALGNNIKQLIDDPDIELIVMGAPAGGALDHLLTGSATRQVIKATDQPVLIIPVNRNISTVNRIVFATDYNEADLYVLRYLSKMVMKLNCRLDIIHIQIGKNEIFYKPKQKQVFEIYLTGLNYEDIYCHELHGKDLPGRLNRFCKDKKVDILAMVNYHHNFFSRMFGNSQTFKTLHHLQLPLLVFPGNFCNHIV